MAQHVRGLPLQQVLGQCYGSRVNSEEPDFLAGIEPEVGGPFAREVRSAFLQVHGLRGGKAIAEKIGVKPPSLSEAFGNVATMNAKTLRKFLAHFESSVVRERIVEAWLREALAEDMANPDAEVMGEDAVRTVGELVADKRLELALRLARLAQRSENDPARLRRLRRSTIYLSYRLDDVLAQAEIGTELADAGRSAGEASLVALGRAVSARAMRRAGVPRSALLPVWEEVLRITGASVPSVSPEHDDAAYARDLIESERAAEVIEYHRLFGRQEKELEALMPVAAERYRRATTPAGRRQARILEASVHLGLGRFFQANETLERAFKDGGDWRGTPTFSGLLHGRILSAEGDREAAIHYYRRLVEACVIEREVYLQRLATMELARLIGGRK